MQSSNTLVTRETFFHKKKPVVKKEFLGQGAYSFVYRGSYNGKKVAIKVSRSNEPNGVTLAQSLTSLKSEQEVLRAIQKGRKQYPEDKEAAMRLLRYYCGHTDKNEDNSVHRFSLVVGYSNAGSLAEWIFNDPRSAKKTNIKFEWKVAYPIAKDMMQGLYFLHKIGYIHCDVKPENVLLHFTDGKLRGKLCDFGLTQKKEGPFKSCGTPVYAAPEVFLDEKISEQVDIYAFGVTLFEMQAHYGIYDSIDFCCVDGFVEYVVDYDQRDNIPLNTPPKIAHLITWCWQRDPLKRPTDVTCLKELETGIESISPELAQHKRVDYNLLSGKQNHQFQRAGDPIKVTHKM